MSRPERQHRRYAHEAAITLLSPESTIYGRTRDLSNGGLCAMLPAPLEIGADIEIDIQLVFEDEGQSEPLRVPARIVWCTQVDDGYQTGMRFLPLTGETAEYLRMFLRFLEDDDARTKSARPESVDDRFG